MPAPKRTPIKLTKSLIDSLAYQGMQNKNGSYTRDVQWDAVLSGFGVRILPSGKKAFVMSYRVGRAKKLKAIGQFGKLTLEEARKDAQAKFARVLSQEDPFSDRDALRKEKTVEEICTDYVELYAKQHKKTWREDERRIRRDILPRFGNKQISTIDNQEISRLHHDVTKRAPYEANRLVRLLSIIFRLATQWGYYQGNNPAKGIRANRERKRDRWITPQELKRIAEELDKEPNLYAAKAIWMYLLTGARKSEILNAKWDDVDWDRREIRFRETKNGETHYVPLSEPALGILRELPRVEGNAHLFPGLVDGAPVVNISKPWLRIVRAAKIEDIRLHDLRRTVGSWLAQAGNSLHLIGRVLNHKNQSTTAIYARFDQYLVRNALEDHAKRVMVAVGKAPKAEVIRFPDPLDKNQDWDRTAETATK